MGTSAPDAHPDHRARHSRHRRGIHRHHDDRAAIVQVEVDPSGLLRLFVLSLGLGLAMSALAANTTIVFKHRGAVVVLALHLAAAYLLTFMVPMLDWPEWVNRLSVFHAFGKPVHRVAVAESTVIIALAGPGLLLAFILTARSRKVP